MYIRPGVRRPRSVLLHELGHLFDLRSESARLALAARLFRAALKRLDFVERAQARARSNGRVRFPA